MAKVTHEDVIAIIKGTGAQVDWEKLDPKESLAEQGADSLDMISIIFAFQEKYHIEITDESISNGEWLSVDNIVTNLNNFLHQK